MSVKVSSDLRTQMFREDGAKDDARSGAFSAIHMQSIRFLKFLQCSRKLHFCEIIHSQNHLYQARLPDTSNELLLKAGAGEEQKASEELPYCRGYR